MTAHILFENIDPQNPVTLSEKFLKSHLRDELNYMGLIITDDLDMKALSKNASPEDLTFAAFQAGANMFLFCNDAKSHTLAVESMMDRLGQFDESSLKHIQTSFDLLLEVKQQLPEEAPAMDVIGSAEHKKLADELLS